MGRKQIYKGDAERQRACRERKKQFAIKEPAPWVLRGVPEEIRDRMVAFAADRRRYNEKRSNVGHVVADFLKEALENGGEREEIDWSPLIQLEETIYRLLVDIRCARRSATGVELERQMEGILDDLGQFITDPPTID